MKAKTRKIIFLLCAFGLIVCSALLIIKSGILVTPTTRSLKLLKEISEYDILTQQSEKEREILHDYESGTYTIKKPYIALDPYDMNPLSAVVLFDTERPSRIDITIQGDDVFSTFAYQIDTPSRHHQVPILGLYAGRNNTVLLKATDNYGSTETSIVSITTEALPPDFQTYNLKASLPGKMEQGVTLCIACFDHSYTCILDSQGVIRGYLSDQGMAHGTSIIELKNGNMLATGDEYKQIPYNMATLWEFNWLGKVFKEYEIPNGVHHGITELPNGDILCVSNARNMFESGTREDVAIIVDRTTGSVKKEYDFRKILDEKRRPYQHFDPNIKNVANIDWMHMNAAIWDEHDKGIIVSSPIQSIVVKIDSANSRIKWILGPHEGYEGSSAELKKYLLSPVGDSFEWQWCQHDPVLLPDQDSNPDTLDILLLDNGQSKSFSQTGSVPPDKNYSRGVQYRINEKKMTVRQIWQYGKERGSDCYSTFLGDANNLPSTGNRLLAFGGQLRNNGIPTDDIVSGVLAQTSTESRIVEITKAGKVVFEVAAKGNEFSSSAETYQAERIALYSPHSFYYGLGERNGERVGESNFCSLATDFSPPPVFTNTLIAKFNALYKKDNRLVVNGALSYKGKTYLLGRAYLIFRGTNNVRVFAANSGLNSRFFANINLDDLPKGTYQLSIAGVVREGNDAQNGALHGGHIKTNYKVTKE